MINEYWTKLGCNFYSTREEILLGWNNCSQKTTELRLFVQAVLDPYYREFLKQKQNIDLLLPAGCFSDNYEPGQIDYMLDLFTTPIHKIMQQKNNKSSTKPYVILLNTGSYSPIHLGHIEIMEEAKKELEKHYNVLGGYISPSHDSYVSQKYEGSAAYHSESRIKLCEEMVSDSDWLMIDTWEARYNIHAINFTDVIMRLKQYIKQYAGIDCQIAYVFGADNAGFTWAFLKDDISVCCEREGYTDRTEVVKANIQIDNKRHFFITHKHTSQSSKSIRADKNLLPSKIKDIYEDYKHGQYCVKTPLYLIRDDSEFCTSHLSISKEKIDNFKENLKLIIKNSFTDNMEVLFLDIKNQQKYLNSLGENVINLDCCTHSDIQLPVSRLFSLSDGQINPQCLVKRQNLEQMAQNIPPGKYHLVDDDIASGNTMKLIKGMLPEGVHILDTHALSEYSFYEHFSKETPYAFHDIIDIRDFIMGSKHGGLVVDLFSDIGRVPYCLPYVSLVQRAKIDPDKQLRTSLDIWRANKNLYENTGYKIKDMSHDFQKTMKFLQFSEDMTMIDFCDFHSTALEKLVF